MQGRGGRSNLEGRVTHSPEIGGKERVTALERGNLEKRAIPPPKIGGGRVEGKVVEREDLG